MKKINFWILLLIISGLCFVSCQQDGIYIPKQKIKQISVEKTRYYAGDQIGEKESYREDWKWENNLLKSIRRETAGNIETAEMTYDGKIIKTIEIENKKISFSYKNGKISKIETVEGDDSKKITVEVRDKGDIVELHYEISSDAFADKSSFGQITSDLGLLNCFILPGNPSEMLQKNLAEQRNSIAHAKTDKVVMTVTLQYNAKNVGRLMIENKTAETKEVYNYNYDAKKNPFFHSFMNLLELTGAPVFCSQNNITSSYESSNPTVITRYTYEYDNKEWPVSCEKKTVFDPNFPSDYSLEKWKYSY